MSSRFRHPDAARTWRTPRVAVAVGAAMAMLAAATGARGQQTSADGAAALIVFPLIRVSLEDSTDTVLRLSNAGLDPVDLQCFYENGNGHCSQSSQVCDETDFPCSGGGDVCVPGFSIQDFRIRLTPRQPVEWRVSQGLAVLPAAGNQGSVPPVAEDPFIGALRCVAVDSATALPVQSGGPANDDLEGTVTIVAAGDLPNLGTYRAIGMQSISNDGSDVLILGGFDTPEYAGCPTALSLSHFFDGAVEPAAGATLLRTALALVPCSANYVTVEPATATIHFNVYNEFEQRLGASARLSGYAGRYLSGFNPVVFDVGVQGTLAGQTRITSIGTGVIGVAVEQHVDPSDPSLVVSVAGIGLHHQGNRFASDLVILRGP